MAYTTRYTQTYEVGEYLFSCQQERTQNAHKAHNVKTANVFSKTAKTICVKNYQSKQQNIYVCVYVWKVKKVEMWQNW